MLSISYPLGKFAYLFVVCASPKFSQPLGEIDDNGAVFALCLRRVHCDVDESRENRRLWTSEIQRSIKAGTLVRLVRHLAPLGEDEEISYRMCFLATYRSFTNSKEVLDLIEEW